MRSSCLATSQTACMSPDLLIAVVGVSALQVRYWDVTAGEQLARLDGHADYVRACAASPASPDVWATGSYDHSVHLWDVRSAEVPVLASCVMQLPALLHTADASAARAASCQPAMRATGRGDAMHGKVSCAPEWVPSVQCTMTLDHGAPIEATAFLPGGALLATAGGTEIRCVPSLQHRYLVHIAYCCSMDSSHGRIPAQARIQG
jgi:WD40 repeat protein